MHMEPSARSGWGSYSLGCLSSWILEWANGLYSWNPRAASTPPKGYGRLHAFLTKRHLLVPKEGHCHGKLLIHSWIYIPNHTFVSNLFYLCDFLGRLLNKFLWLRSGTVKLIIVPMLRPSFAPMLRNHQGLLNRSSCNCPRSWNRQTRLVPVLRLVWKWQKGRLRSSAKNCIQLR